MDHPDFQAAWLDDAELDALAADFASSIISPNLRRRVHARTRYILDKYLEVVRDVGLRAALRQATEALEAQGMSAAMVAEATRGWRETHGVMRASPTSPLDEGRIQQIDTQLNALAANVAALAERGAQRTALLGQDHALLVDRVIALEHALTQVGHRLRNLESAAGVPTPPPPQQ